MHSSGITRVVLAAAVALAGLMDASAKADENLLGGALIGGIISGTIENDSGKAAPTRRSRPEHIEKGGDVRAVQRALNYFGFDAGTPDGLRGPRTRQASSAFQASIGDPATGRLTQGQSNLLQGAYSMAIIAPDPLNDEASRKAFLEMHVSEIRSGKGPQTVMAIRDRESRDLLFQVIDRDDAPLLPVFRTDLKTLCAGAQKNPQTTAPLDRAFCALRDAAIGETSHLARQIPSSPSAAQVADTCKRLARALNNEVKRVGADEPAVVLTALEERVASAQNAPEQVAVTARVCLGSGYETGDMKSTLTAALLLTALDRETHAEIVGHHLRLGAGTESRPGIARDWYAMAIDAMDRGEKLAFEDVRPEAPSVLREGAVALVGEDETTATPSLRVLPKLDTGQLDAAN